MQGRDGCSSEGIASSTTSKAGVQSPAASVCSFSLIHPLGEGGCVNVRK